MPIWRLLTVSFLVTAMLFPMSMSSADIMEYEWTQAKVVRNLNDHIVPFNLNLRSTLVAISSDSELADPKIVSSCPNSQKVAYNSFNASRYSYLIYFSLDWDCTDNKIKIGNWNVIYEWSEYILPINQYSSDLSSYADYSDKRLSDAIAQFNNNTNLVNPVLDNPLNVLDKIKNLQSSYEMKINDYRLGILKYIEKNRKNLHYISPVVWKQIPTKKNLMPNTLRPYRAQYTDGIHHGWDVYADHFTPTRAMADWVIIRVKRDFMWSDFNKITYKNLSSDDRALNLDIYRWNQVWLKTYDGNVVIYAHLENIPEYLKEGMIVKEWSYFWQVWRSWVPDKEYTDFHLHFEVQVNAHNSTNESFLDIMRWSWLWKWLSYQWIITMQNSLFNWVAIAKL